ncbi:MAG: hypothetical protein V2A56_02170 [bacterium]
MMKSKQLLIVCLAAVIVMFVTGCATKSWAPSTDWGHWRLGHRSDSTFLADNQFTLTFGSGAPNFPDVTRAQFDSSMLAARQFNDAYHDREIIVLRYLSTSLEGNSATPKSEPRKDQIGLLDFYNKRWSEFEDYIGPKPASDPTSWLMVRSDGTFPYYRYAPYGQETDEGFEAWGCPHNPDYVRYMEGRIRAQAETGIDGSYIDWTQIAGGTCYCDHSVRAFREYLTQNLPKEIAIKKYGTAEYETLEPPTGRGQPFWAEWVTFRGESVANFHHHMREIARKYNPHFLISGNVYGGFGYGPIAYDAAGNIEMLGRDGVDDFVYSEIQEYLEFAPRRRSDGVRITNSPALRFLTAATHGKPVIVYATEITPPIFPEPTERALSAMAQINIAEAAAGHAVFREKRETPPGATQMHRLLASAEPYLLESKMDGEIAVVAMIRPYLHDELSFAFTASRVLADRGVHHVMLVSDDLRVDRLARYPLVLVPYQPLLTNGEIEALLDYARQGGTLVLLGDCGHKDGYGLERETPPFESLFNQADERVATVGSGSIIRVPLDIPEHRFLVRGKQRADATTFGPAMLDVFPDVPEAYTRDNIHPELRTHLESLVDTVLEKIGDRVTRRLSEHPWVEVSRMAKSDGSNVLLHLVNYDVTIKGDITAASNVVCQLALPKGRRIEHAWLYRPGCERSSIEPVVTGGVAQVTVPELDIYALVAVELEE